MAVSVGFTLSPGRAPTGNVSYNGAGVNFDLSRDRNISNQNAVMTPRDQLNLNSLSNVVSNNVASIPNRPSINVSSPNTSNSNQHDLVDYIGAIAPFVGAALTFGSNRHTNSVNENIASNNQAIVEANNIRNIEFQREENAITRQREDNAFQRAAYDLQLAGLSKTLAAGSPASASALSAPSAQAATLDYKYQNPMQGIDLANLALSVMKTMADIKNSTNLTNAQVGNLNAQANLTNISAQTEGEKNEANIAYTKQLTIASEQSARYTSLQADYLEKYGDKEMLAKIDQYTTNAVLNRSSSYLNYAKAHEVAQSVVESIARTSKIRTEEKNLLEDIAYTQLMYKQASFNLDVSKELNIRTTDSLPTMLGFPIGGFRRGWNQFSTWAKDYFKYFIK